MILEKTSQPVTCCFDGNSLTEPLPGSLNIPNPYCVLREISIKRPCICNTAWLDNLSSRDLRSETYCTVDDKLKYCFNTSVFNVLKYLHEVCDDTKETLHCGKNRNLKKINGIFFTPEELASLEQKTPKLILFVSAIIITLAILAIIALITANRCARDRTKTNGRIQSRSSTTTAGSAHLHSFSYDDRRVIDRTMQVLQKKYPEVYKTINDKTKTLMQHDIPDKKCIKLISDIVNLLDNCENSEEDFKAFNEILLQHLQPPMPTAPPADPIYAEPTAPASGINNGCSSSSSSNTEISPTTPSEHIYAEPNCAQQPLLRNEYASPADRNIDAMDLYSEPIHELGKQFLMYLNIKLFIILTIRIHDVIWDTNTLYFKTLLIFDVVKLYLYLTLFRNSFLPIFSIKQKFSSYLTKRRRDLKHIFKS